MYCIKGTKDAVNAIAVHRGIDLNCPDCGKEMKKKEHGALVCYECSCGYGKCIPKEMINGD